MGNQNNWKCRITSLLFYHLPFQFVNGQKFEALLIFLLENWSPSNFAKEKTLNRNRMVAKEMSLMNKCDLKIRIGTKITQNW